MEGGDLDFGESAAPMASQEASRAHQPTQLSQGEGAGKPPASGHAVHGNNCITDTCY